MKRVGFIVLFLLVAAGSAYGQTWYPANQAEVQWNQVTTLADGRQVPADNVIQYAVYIATDKGNPTEVVDFLELTSFLISFSQEGRFYVGVQAIRLMDGAEVSRSEISWSDNQEVSPDPFGIWYFVSPARPDGLVRGGGGG